MPPRRRTTQAVETPSSRRSTRTLRPDPSPLPEQSPTPNAEEDEEPSPGPSRARGKAASRRGGRASRPSLSRVKSETAEGSESDGQRERRRLRKSVSYREIGLEEGLEDEDEQGEEGEDGEGDEDGEGEGVDDVDGDEGDIAPSTPSRGEKVGSGRGGFSVKGAAAAAARARWAKVRRERAERGEDDDDGPSVRRRTGGGGGARKGDARSAAVEGFEMDSIITIKGVDYTVGDDELIIDDDPKGDTKIDALGNLLGGREYKLTTFTSPTRRSPTKVYALTIDAARACGYTDSLAFLRRCPQLLKLACNSDERHMLIEIGRVTGNLRNRMVTMVAMRNVYKLMGARVVKNGKWVTDDYYEEKSLAECVENGFTPGAVAHEDEILANALTSLNPQGRPPNNTATAEITRQAANLTSFYTLGGPTTTFAGNGADPFSEHGHGHKRARLRNVGVTEEDWILRTAEESRRIDAQLKAYRDERLVELNGPDLNGWVWTAERSTEKIEGRDDLSLPKVERRRSALSHEVVLQGYENEPEADTSMQAAPREIGGDGDANVEAGKIVVQTPEETRRASAAFNWGLGSWVPGLVKAAYEPHTHMPHVPSYTQPSTATSTRLSHFPILAAQADTQHKNFVMSSVTGRAARGLASVEYVLETSEDRRGIKDVKDLFEFTSGGSEVLERMVRDAEEWEKREREKKAALVGV